MDIAEIYQAFKSIETDEEKIAYLEELSQDEEMKTADIDWDTLIDSWKNKNWPMKRAMKEY